LPHLLRRIHRYTGKADQVIFRYLDHGGRFLREMCSLCGFQAAEEIFNPAPLITSWYYSPLRFIFALAFFFEDL
jgi:hypothetical protein